MAGRKGGGKKEGSGYNRDAHAPENYQQIKDQLLQQLIEEAREAAAGDDAVVKITTRCALIAHYAYEALGKRLSLEEIKVVLDAADRAAAVLEVPPRPQTFQEFEARQWALFFTDGEEPPALDDDAPRRMGMQPR
jgi:hypothetical protein